MKSLRLTITLFALCFCSIANTLAEDNASSEASSPKRLFLIGDSTVKCGSGNGGGGMWGWGQVLQEQFDADRLQVKNHAIGGRSSRTFLTEGRWDKALAKMQAGDYLLIQFGHNDGGQMFEGTRPRASIKGIGEESKDGVVEATGKAETVHSYGWYLRHYVTEAKAKGVTPIVLSLVPRTRWKDGKVIRSNRDYGKWARESAEMSGALFVDLNGIVSDRYEEEGEEKVRSVYFTEKDHTHTSKKGAKVNAACVVKGIRQLEATDLKQYLKPAAVEETAEKSPGQAAGITMPFSFSTEVEEGNHLVRVTFGSATEASHTRVEAELRRLMLDDVVTKVGEFVTKEFVVNTRTPQFEGGVVRLKDREKRHEAPAWDTKLTLIFTGDNPAVASVEVLPLVKPVPTVYLLGDSTVCDQVGIDWASWGQKLPRYFGTDTAVANHAESGETVRGAVGAKRAEKIFSCIKPGDWLFVQFGHNDMKIKGDDALPKYRKGIEKIVAKVRSLGATPVLVTSMERKAGVHKATLEPYPQTVRDIAKDLDVAMIDLHKMSQEVYQKLGDRLDSAFQDATHHTNIGADLLASCIVQGIRSDVPELAKRLNEAEPVLP